MCDQETQKHREYMKEYRKNYINNVLKKFR